MRDDWDQVHDILVSGGNVRAVFAAISIKPPTGPQDGIDICLWRRWAVVNRSRFLKQDGCITGI